MRLLVLLALVLPSASVAAPAQRPGPAATVAASNDCRDYSRLRMAGRPGTAARVTPLGDEPAAALALTVYREVGGCPDPAILRTGIGPAPASGR